MHIIWIIVIRTVPDPGRQLAVKICVQRLTIAPRRGTRRSTTTARGAPP